MIGYRYVSENDWLEIQEKGLLPRHVRDWEVAQHWQGEELKGIWIWKRPLTGSAHVGAIIHQAIQKCSMKVYLLKVQYNPKWELTHKDYSGVNITHTGLLGKWKNWSEDASIGIITRKIAKKQIRLLEIYDLTERLWQRKNTKAKN